ncbi:MAG TPA: DUF881 domain-containing protein [Candidatus Limnocylindrales bacterium]|jgi:uncharacterized protein YlxW (UPF0749 family)
MNKRRNQLSLAIVAFLLGGLIVVQLRSQEAGNGLDQLTPTELTVLVGNLNTRNDQLRAEIATTQAELSALQASDSRGDTSVGQLQSDLAKVRAWTGLDPVSGPGVRITVTGGIDAPSVQALVNELRNAGAEAIAVNDLRVEPNSVINGPVGGLLIGSTALGDPFQVSAIGNPETLTGSLTRAGGIVAQLAATAPSAQLIVTPIDMLLLPATTEDLVPAHGRPQL